MSDPGEVREREIRERAERCNLAFEMHGQRKGEMHGRYAVDVEYLLSRLSELEEENRRLREATRTLLDELSDYYFSKDDPELKAVNALRALVGMAQQAPKELSGRLEK